MRARLPLFLLTATVSVLAAANRVPLTGKVTDASGKPLEHATVMVYHAGVKTGYSTFCPSCYADCGKRAFTDAAGAFSIPNLDSDLWFELLVIHDGYTPVFVPEVDPVQGPAKTAALSLRTPVADPMRAVYGRVVDAHGHPVRDAVVESEGVSTGAERDERSAYGSIQGLDPVAVTDQKGEFELSHAVPANGILVRVEPRGMTERVVALRTGTDRQNIEVGDGVVIRGRLVDHGKPVASAQVGLYPQKPAGFGAKLKIFGDPYSEIRIGTREDGSFVIPNVPAGVKWYVYGKMSSIAARGAAGPKECGSKTDGSEVDLGDLEIKPGLRLSGTVTLSDGAQVAAGMRAYVSATRGWDSQEVALGPDGRFDFAGLASGDYKVWTAVRGYASPVLMVTVDRDMNALTIKLERR